MTELNRLQGLDHEVQSHARGKPVGATGQDLQSHTRGKPVGAPGQDLHEELTQEAKNLQDHEKHYVADN